MPRASRPRNITLYLPPPGTVETPANDADKQGHKPQHQPSAQPTANPPSLEVLLMAQQIAHSRGHTFDIDSFLLPEQREEYLALLARERTEEVEEEAEGDGQRGESGERDPGAPTTETEGRDTANACDESADSASRKSPSRSSPSGSTGTSTPPPRLDAYSLGDDSFLTLGDSGADALDRPSKRARLAQHASPLAQAYWRQRLDRMTGGRRSRSASRSATPRIKNEPDEPATPAGPSTPSAQTPSPSHYLRRHDMPPAPLTHEERVDIQSSASYWNHLLIQARASRGPQWDYNTNLYQYDRGSLEYYTHGQEPPDSPPPPSPKPLPAESSTITALPNGTANGELDRPASASSSQPSAGAIGGTRVPPSPSAGPSAAGGLTTPSSATSRLPGASPVSASASAHTPGGQPAASPVPAHIHVPGAGRPPIMPATHQQAQAHAQARVQAQALALGAAGDGFMNPSLMLSGSGVGGGAGAQRPGSGRQPTGTSAGTGVQGPPQLPAGINPLALMGG